jgi:HEAT repeat protein
VRGPLLCRGSRTLNRLTLLATLCALLAAFQLPLFAASTEDEQHFIQVLQSNASLVEKDAACARLKRIGTVHCVPALAALLPDEQLSHSARYALESMPLAEASQALIGALDKTSGLTRVGIIDSLGFRREPDAVPALAKLLNGPALPSSAGASDVTIVSATATALGQIGGPQALKALQAAVKKSSGPAHDAEVDALLRCANQLLATANDSKARALFKSLYDREGKDAIRIAAFRGMARASTDGGLSLIIGAIAGKTGPTRTAALQLVHDLKAPEATKTLAELLPKLQPLVQAALIGGLTQRNDPSAAPAIMPLLTSPAPGVRLAAIDALGTLGDASAVPGLAAVAASAPADEQKAARQSLCLLRSGNVTETLLAQLTTTSPEVQAEVARALAERGDKSAIPRLVELAETGTAPTRQAALQALASLAEEPQLGSLVEFVLKAKDPAARASAVEALSSACRRLQLAHGHLNTEALAKGLQVGSPDARIALLPVCSGLVSPQARVALRAAVQDSDERIRAAALRALCDAVDTDLLLDLADVALHAKDQTIRALAVRGCVRLSTQDETPKLPRKLRLGALKSLLAASLPPDQTRQVLAGLAEIPDPDVLTLVEPLLEDAEVKNEAVRAVLKVAVAVPTTESPAALAVLKKALAAAADDATRRDCQTAIKDIETRADYITSWQVAGPYRQKGKDYSALFDIAFPPEPGYSETATPAPPATIEPASPPESQQKVSAPSAGLSPAGGSPSSAALVPWKNLPPGGDTKRPYAMDLLKPLGGGEQCVAYARTWVQSDDTQPARLEVGSDDGVKVWLNDKLVLANNVSRALQPGAERVDVTLNRGWNLLLFKITQNNRGWAFCARVLKPDGSHLDGLTFDTTRASLPQGQ